MAKEIHITFDFWTQGDSQIGGQCTNDGRKPGCDGLPFHMQDSRSRRIRNYSYVRYDYEGDMTLHCCFRADDPTPYLTTDTRQAHPDWQASQADEYVDALYVTADAGVQIVDMIKAYFAGKWRRVDLREPLADTPTTTATQPQPNQPAAHQEALFEVK